MVVEIVVVGPGGLTVLVVKIVIVWPRRLAILIVVWVVKIVIGWS